MADLGGWAKIEGELYGPKGLWTSIFTANTSAQSRGEIRVDGLGHAQITWRRLGPRAAWHDACFTWV